MKFCKLCVSLFFMIVILSCCKTSESLDRIGRIVEMDSIFCNRLMSDLGGGVTGADGSISIDLGNGKSLYMWGDSFFGDVVNGQRSDSSKLVMGNVFTVIDSNKVTHYYQGDAQHPSSYIMAEPIKDYPTWYWPGHGFVENGILHLFMSKFYKENNEMFGFAYNSCDYFRLDASNLQILSRKNFPAATINGVHYGHAVFYDGKFAYIYGTRVDQQGIAEVHVARTIILDKELSDFNYWNGNNWQKDPKQSQKIKGIKQSVSEQFNVVRLHDKIVLVTQDRLNNVKDIYSYTSNYPQGPFTNEKIIFTVNEKDYDKDKMMTYNTMVHPQYIKNDKVLMCYNVNTSDFSYLLKKASLYKPRFFWMPIHNILDSCTK